MALNAALVELDAQIQRYSDDPAVQMGILMMAQVKAFRRLLAQHDVSNRGKRHKLMSMAVRDFESKLKTHCVFFGAKTHGVVRD